MISIKKYNQGADSVNKSYFSTLFYELVKQIFDLIVSATATVVLLIPMLVISLIITVSDFGNPIYIQNRVGKNGRIIKVFKFRSMAKGADKIELTLSPEQKSAYEAEFKLADDPRMIGYEKNGQNCLGAKIRRISLDEILQIPFNILIYRNMSIVGPRPILKSELEKNYTKEQQEIFLSVKPGLTGYWQAYARNNVGYVSGKRQEMELYYIKNRSLKFDLKIILKTFEAVLKKNGAQ